VIVIFCVLILLKIDSIHLLSFCFIVYCIQVDHLILTMEGTSPPNTMQAANFNK